MEFSFPCFSIRLVFPFFLLYLSHKWSLKILRTKGLEDVWKMKLGILSTISTCNLEILRLSVLVCNHYSRQISIFALNYLKLLHVHKLTTVLTSIIAVSVQAIDRINLFLFRAESYNFIHKTLKRKSRFWLRTRTYNDEMYMCVHLWLKRMHVLFIAPAFTQFQFPTCCTQYKGSDQTKQPRWKIWNMVSKKKLGMLLLAIFFKKLIIRIAFCWVVRECDLAWKSFHFNYSYSSA